MFWLIQLKILILQIQLQKFSIRHCNVWCIDTISAGLFRDERMAEIDQQLKTARAEEKVCFFFFFSFVVKI